MKKVHIILIKFVIKTILSLIVMYLYDEISFWYMNNNYTLSSIFAFISFIIILLIWAELKLNFIK